MAKASNGVASRRQKHQLSSQWPKNNGSGGDIMAASERKRNES